MGDAQDEKETASKGPAAPAEDFTNDPEAAALLAAGREVIASLRQLNARLRPLAVKLTVDERRSGVGKMLRGEAAELVKVARYAMSRPELTKGFAAKDGGVDPTRFEGEALIGHLAVHEVARALRDEVEGEAKEMLGLLGDVAIHRALLARPVLLGVYRLLAQHAKSDGEVQGALQSVIEFFDRPSAGRARSAEGRRKPA